MQAYLMIFRRDMYREPYSFFGFCFIVILSPFLDDSIIPNLLSACLIYMLLFRFRAHTGSVFSMLLPHNKGHEFLYVLVVAISLNVFSSLMAFGLSQTAVLAFSSTLFIASFLVWIDMYAASKKIAGVTAPLVALTIIIAYILSSNFLFNVSPFSVSTEKIIYLVLILMSAAIICFWKVFSMYFAINEYAASPQSLRWLGKGGSSIEDESDSNTGFNIIYKAKHINHSYLQLWSIVFSFFSSNKNLSRQLFKNTHEIYALLPLMLLMVSLITESGIDILVSTIIPMMLAFFTYLGRDFVAKKRLMAYSWLLARGVSRQQYNMQLVWVLISQYIFVYFLTISLIALGSAASSGSKFFGLSSTELAMALGAASVFQICLTLEVFMRVKPESDSYLTLLIYQFIFLGILGLSMFLISMSAFWLLFLIILGGGCVFYSLSRWQTYDLQMD